MDTGGLWDVLPTVERGDTLGESANEWYLTKIEKRKMAILKPSTMVLPVITACGELLMTLYVNV